jgi:class 3 adenylate cyclase
MRDSQELTVEVASIFDGSFETRDGRIVPEAEDVGLGNDAVLLDGTVLYADLAKSTQLVTSYKDWFAAKVYKSYLVCACKVIRKNGGVVTAFDGDRVMAVYTGALKNTSAAKTALQINSAVLDIINPVIAKKYPSAAYQLSQAVGVATGKLFVARTGIRGANDLVWVGNSANYAAKMSALRYGSYSSYITKEVFDAMNSSSKYGGNPSKLMWEEYPWHENKMLLYRSNWKWPI